MYAACCDYRSEIYIICDMRYEKVIGDWLFGAFGSLESRVFTLALAAVAGVARFSLPPSAALDSAAL